MATMKRKAYETNESVLRKWNKAHNQTRTFRLPPVPEGATHWVLGYQNEDSKRFVRLADGAHELPPTHIITEIDREARSVTLERISALGRILSTLLANNDLRSVLVALRNKVQSINDEHSPRLLTNDPEPAEEVIYYLGRAIQHSRRMPGAKNANRE
jgi:hypothetical protein